MAESPVSVFTSSTFSPSSRKTPFMRMSDLMLTTS